MYVQQTKLDERYAKLKGAPKGTNVSKWMVLFDAPSFARVKKVTPFKVANSLTVYYLPGLASYQFSHMPCLKGSHSLRPWTKGFDTSIGEFGAKFSDPHVVFSFRDRNLK